MAESKKLINDFKKKSFELFDVAFCKCSDNRCICPKDKKVPQEKMQFLLDQRTKRVLSIRNMNVNFNNNQKDDLMNEFCLDDDLQLSEDEIQDQNKSDFECVSEYANENSKISNDGDLNFGDPQPNKIAMAVDR